MAVSASLQFHGCVEVALDDRHGRHRRRAQRRLITARCIAPVQVKRGLVSRHLLAQIKAVEVGIARVLQLGN